MKFQRTSYLALFLLLFWGVPCAAQDAPWENYFNGGLRALQEGELQKAELLLKASRLKAELEAEAGNPNASEMIIQSLSGIALVLRQEGRPAEAEQVLREQLQLLKSFHRGEDDPQTSLTLHNLGLMLFDQEKYGEAKDTLKKAVELRRKYDEQPKRNLAISLLSLGAVDFQLGKIEDGQIVTLEAREVLSKIPAGQKTPEDMAATMRSDHNLALGYVEQKKYEAAEESFKRAIQAMESLYGPTSNGLVLYLTNYAKLLKTLKRDKEAETLLQRAEKLKEQKSRFEVPKKITS
jgi:tetratricopeptide (TPR) repeat protein